MTGISIFHIPSPASQQLQRVTGEMLQNPNLPVDLYQKGIRGTELYAWKPASEYRKIGERVEQGDVILFYDADFGIYSTIGTVEQTVDGPFGEWFTYENPTEEDTVIFLSDYETVPDYLIHIDNLLTLSGSQLSWVVNEGPVFRQTPRFDEYSSVHRRLSGLLRRIEQEYVYSAIRTGHTDSIYRALFGRIVLGVLEKISDLRQAMRDEEPLSTKLLNWVFTSAEPLRRIGRVSFAALFPLWIFLILHEVLSCVSGKLKKDIPLVANSCWHPITVDFLDQATKFSFSLTAFLLVSTTVVVALERIRGRVLIPVGQLEVTEIGSEEDRRPSELSIREYRNGSMVNNGTVEWWLKSRDGNVFRVTEYRASPPDIGLATGQYAIQPLSGTQDTEAGPATDKHGWVVSGSLQGASRRLQKDYPNEFIAPDEEIEWWVTEEAESEEILAKMRKRIRRTATYSISASLLGVFMTGYPWAGPNSSSWLESLSTPENIAYVLFSHAFLYVFLGMVWTSLGVLDLLVTDD